MPFPDSQRVVYNINTLEEVKCQLRFPTILSIESSLPAAFQDALRIEFPYFEQRTTVKLPDKIPPAVARIVEQDLLGAGTKTFAFSSEDRVWTLELNKESLSLICRKYPRWEFFREKLLSAFEALTTIYKPAFFLHTCVRYKNSVRREELGLQGSSWARLLQPWVSGPLQRLEVADDVQAVQTKCMFLLPEHVGRLEATLALGVHQPSKRPAFIVEAHVFDDSRKGANDVLSRLDLLHRYAGRFFRWCISDELHDAMGPKSI